MTDPAQGLSVLHVIVRAGPTNSQYNEHVLPVLGSRRITVCSLFPATVTPPPHLTLYQGDGTLRGSLRVVRRALLAERHDIVHVHAPASGMVTLLAHLMIGRSLGNALFTLHNSWANFKLRNRLFLRFIMALFPVVVVCGHAAYESLPRRLRRLHDDKLVVVPNGVDVQRVDRALVGRSGMRERAAQGLEVVSVNRLIPTKDPSTLVRAFGQARRPGDRLTLIGDGELRPDVERMLTGSLSASVELVGVVPRDEVYGRLAEADLFVSTSAGEGLPVALLEAMACGVPVVVSDIAPHREVARLAAGLPLVPVGDVDGFARSIDDLRRQTVEQRREIGRRLRRCVEEHFSVGVMNDSYGTLYRELAPYASTSMALRHPANVARHREAVTLFDKLRRRLLLLSVMTVLGAVAGFWIGSVQSPVYKGETTIQVGRTLGVGVDEDAMKTSTALASRYADLARRQPVLEPVAEAGFADSWKHLQDDVFSQVGDKNPQMVQISVYAGDRAEAGRLARAVAASLIEVSRESLRSSDGAFLRKQLDDLQAEITATSTALETEREVLAGLRGDDADTARSRVEELEARLADQRSAFAELGSLDKVSAGVLFLVDSAWTTRSPLRPTPVVLGLAGATIGAMLAAGWIHLFSRGRRLDPVVGHPVPAHVPSPSPARDHGQATHGVSNGYASPARWAAPDGL
jgi:glycosyltransferase involved in cell wall biosynthesis/capsular polysaccharide biosynthesis protein